MTPQQPLSSKNILLIRGGLAFLLILGGIWSAGQIFKPPESKAGGPPGGFVMPVSLLTLSKQPTTDTSDFMAELISDESTTIKPQIEGRIVRVFVADGQQVRKGQPLFQLDNSQQQALVNSLEATSQSTGAQVGVVVKGMDALRADRKGILADLAFNQQQLARYEALKTTDSVSSKDVEQYQSTVKQLQSRLGSLDANIQGQQQQIKQISASVLRDKAARDSAKASLGFYTIKAPFTGTVGEVKAKLGDVVDANTLLTSLTNNNTLELQSAIGSDSAGKLKPGGLLEMLNSQNDPVGTARITFIAPNVDSLSQTVLVKATVPNRQGMFRADQKLKARVIWGSGQALKAPTSAVFRMAGQPFVYLAKPGKAPDQFSAKMVPVTLGPIQGDGYILKSGVKEGDRVITSSIQKLQDNMPVSELKQ
jgi:multidrug efflux pump subunit AcrA (membrane-fusion protein)